MQSQAAGTRTGAARRHTGGRAHPAAVCALLPAGLSMAVGPPAVGVPSASSAPPVVSPQNPPTRSPLAQGVTATPEGRFSITLHEGHHTSGRVRGAALLNCSPSAGSSHPRAEEACAALARVSGDFAELPAHNLRCPPLDRPVTVVAEGTWRTRPRGFAHTYANLCAAGAESARVFDLSTP